MRSPDYEEYSGSFSTGPLVRMALKDTQLLEIFSGYSNTEYFKPALAPEEDRDAEGYKSYISFLWLFKKGLLPESQVDVGYYGHRRQQLG